MNGIRAENGERAYNGRPVATRDGKWTKSKTPFGFWDTEEYSVCYVDSDAKTEEESL